MTGFFSSLSSRSRAWLVLLLGGLLLGVGRPAAWAQSANDVRVTVLVLPPYSTHLSDYVDQPNRLVVTLTNTTRGPLNLQLTAALSGDNGVRVQTAPQARSPRPVALAALQSRTLDRDELGQLFDQSQLSYSGITAQQVLRGNGLPEGSYTLCVRALDYATGQPRSQENPLGCSRTFLLRSLEPPILIKPLADEVIKAQSPQNILFTWTRPAGAAPSTEYELRIVEMSDPKRNPNDAFLAGTVPPLFERTTTGVTTLLYGPAEPALIPGRRYAFAVTARDPQGRSVFRNNGRSEVSTFVYGAASVTPYANTNSGVTPPAAPIKMVVVPPPAGPTVTYQPVFHNTTVSAQIVGFFPDDPQGKQHPLAKKSVKLVIDYEAILPDGSKSVNAAACGLMPDYHKVLATGTTDANGNVQLSYVTPVNFRTTADTSFRTSGGEFPVTFTGRLKRGVRVLVDNIYYTSPENIFQPKAGTNAVFFTGLLRAGVRSVSLYVRLQPRDFACAEKLENGQAKLDPLVGVPVYILRKWKPTAFPPEGNASGEKSPVPGFVVISKTKADLMTTLDGVNYATAKFNMLLPGFNSSTPYYLYADAQDESMGSNRSFAYTCAPMPVLIGKEDDPDLKPMLIKKVQGQRRDLRTLENNKYYKSNSQWNVKSAIDVANLSLDPAPPRIVGNTYRGENISKALPDVTAVLHRINADWTTSAERTAVSRDKDGFYALSKVYPDVSSTGQLTGPAKRYVRFSKNGYQPFITPMLNNNKPLAYGQQLDLGKQLLQPLGKVKGEVIGDEVQTVLNINTGGLQLPSGNKGNKKNQIGQVSVANGELLTPPVRVWVGEGLPQELNKPKQETPGPRAFEVAAPTGKQTLHIEPYDANYFTLDTLLNVTGEKYSVGRVRLQHKRHRLQVVAYLADKSGGTAGSVTGVTTGVGGLPTNAGVAVNTAAVNTPLATGSAPAAGGKKGGKKSTGGSADTMPGAQSGINTGLSAPKGMSGTTTPGANSPQMAVMLPGLGQAIGGVKVEVLELSEPMEATTSGKGAARLVFASSATKFRLRLTPDNGQYQAREVNLVNYVSREDSVYYVALEPAAVVRGQVRLGQMPIANARVFVDMPGQKIETFADAQGNYMLGGVPVKQPLTLRAVGKGGNYVGAELQRTFAASTDGVDLLITEYNKMDITRLLGVPIEVETLEEKGGQVSITGAFTQLRGSAGLTLMDTTLRLPFGSTAVKAGSVKNAKGLPYIVPVSGNSVASSETKAEVQVNGTLKGVLYRADGLRVVGEAGGQPGAVRGAVYLPTTQLKDANLSFGATDKLFLALPGAAATDRLAYAALLPAGSNPAPTPRWELVTAADKPLSYKLYGFAADAAPATSVLGHDTLRLATTLHAQPAGLAAPLNINVGVVRALASKVLPLTGSNQLSLPLEKWALTSGKFKLNTNEGLVLQTGTLQLGGEGGSVPFQDLSIRPQSIGQAKFNVAGLGLNGIGALSLSKEATAQLAYDAGQKHWSLDVTGTDKAQAVASLSGLPDVVGNVELRLLTFFSDQTQALQLVDKSPTLTVNKVASFRPVTLFAGTNSLQLGGALNLNVPQLGEQDAKLSIVRENQQAKLSVSMPDVQFYTGPLVVKMPAGKYQGLPTGGFTLDGTAEEPGVVKFDVRLYRTPDSTAIGILPKQQFKLAQGGGYLDNVRGWMRPSGGQWPLLTFGGDVKNAKGLTGVLALQVKGDLMADNQQISVSNVPTPFGDMKLTFDIPQQRLVGTLPFEKDMGGGTFVHGSANLLVDPTGWMMLSAGELEKTNPTVKGAAMLLVGSHALEPAIVSEFQKFSYFYQTKGVMPPSFPKDVSGFFFEGKAEIPVPIIPQFDIDLIVIKGKLSATMGGDMRLGMNFSNGTEIGIGQSVFVDVELGVGGSIGLACGGVEAGVHADMSADGTVNLSTGAWQATGDASLTITGTAYAGAGICNASCSWDTCTKDSESVTLGAGARVSVGSEGTNYEIYLK